MFTKTRPFGVASLTGGTAAALLVFSAFSVPAARAQNISFATGFEASEGYSTTYTREVTAVNANGPIVTFTPTQGTLFLEPRTAENTFGFTNTGPGSTDLPTSVQASANGTTVVNTSAATGTQSVQIIGNTIGNRSIESFGPNNLVAQSSLGSSLTLAADLRVTNPSAAYGQWGVNARQRSGEFDFSIASFGFVATNVLASNDGGNTLYAAINLNTFTPYSASYGAYNNYAVRLNYDTRTISGFFNNVQVGFVPLDANGNPNPNGFVLNMPFAATTGNAVSFASFGQGIPNGTAENANFDNFRVTGINVAAAPEPGTFALLGMGLVGSAGGFLRRRKAA